MDIDGLVNTLMAHTADLILHKQRVTVQVGGGAVAVAVAVLHKQRVTVQVGGQ